MRKNCSIALLIVIGILVLPWQLIDFCLTHPLGHKHHTHEPGKPTPCELRKQFKDVTAYWPPMDCYEITVESDDFQQPEKVKPAIPTLALVVVFFEIVQTSSDEPFVLLPDPKSNSDPPLAVNPLRGPPLS